MTAMLACSYEPLARRDCTCCCTAVDRLLAAAEDMAVFVLCRAAVYCCICAVIAWAVDAWAAEACTVACAVDALITGSFVTTD